MDPALKEYLDRMHQDLSNRSDAMVAQGHTLQKSQDALALQLASQSTQIHDLALWRSVSPSSRIRSPIYNAHGFPPAMRRMVQLRGIPTSHRLRLGARKGNSATASSCLPGVCRRWVNRRQRLRSRVCLCFKSHWPNVLAILIP